MIGLNRNTYKYQFKRHFWIIIRDIGIKYLESGLLTLIKLILFFLKLFLRFIKSE